MKKTKKGFEFKNNVFTTPNEPQTPLGYAVRENKLGCVDAISSMDGIDLGLGV